MIYPLTYETVSRVVLALAAAEVLECSGLDEVDAIVRLIVENQLLTTRKALGN